jgi:hypothetical protein
VTARIGVPDGYRRNGAAAYKHGYARGKAEGWREAIEAAAKAVCRHCRQGKPFRPQNSSEHLIHRLPGDFWEIGACRATEIRALTPPAGGS